jgi:hypothetical protein
MFGVAGVCFLVAARHLIPWTVVRRDALPSGAALAFPTDHSALRNAAHNLLDELRSVCLRIEQAQREDHYRYDFYLPANAYEQHKQDLTRSLRIKIGEIYVAIGHLNRDVQARESNGTQVLPEDDLDGLRAKIASARRDLDRVTKKRD